MDDLDPGQAELRVLVADGVEAVRAGGHDGADPVLVVGCGEGRHVLLGQDLEQVLVARSPGRVAGAGLAAAQHPERDLGLAQEGGHRPHHLSVPLVERAGAADPVQDPFRSRCRIGCRLAIGLSGRLAVRVAIGFAEDRYVQALGPVQARSSWLAPRVAGGLHVAEGAGQLAREAALLQHEVAADLDDGVDVLDEHRAALDAPAAGRALPDRFFGDGVVDQGQAQGLERTLLRHATGRPPPQRRHRSIRRWSRSPHPSPPAGRRRRPPAPSRRPRSGHAALPSGAWATASCRCTTRGRTPCSGRTRCRPAGRGGGAR